VSAGGPDAADRVQVQPPPSPEFRWAQTLRVHLSVIIVTLLVAISAPLMWLTFMQGRTEAFSAAEQEMKLLSQHTLDRYRSLFGDGYSVAKMAPAVRLLSTEPPGDAGSKADFMIRVLQGSPNIDGVYVGYPSGSFVQMLNVGNNAQWREAISAPEGTVFASRTMVRKSADDAVTEWRFLDSAGRQLGERTTAEAAFDPRRRPWYRAAFKGEGIVPVGPYVSASTGSLTLTFAAPSAFDGSIVIGVDVLLETLSRLLADEPISEHSRGYIFDQNGQLIVHSDHAVMDLLLDTLATNPKFGVSDLEAIDPALAGIRKLVASGEANRGHAVQFAIGEEKYLAELSSVDLEGMLADNTIVVAAPVDDFVGRSEALLRQTLAIAIVVVLAGVLAALVIARGISRALTALAADARQIGNLEFADRPSASSWIVEINTLAAALRSARTAIKTFALYVPRELVRRIVASGQIAAGTATRQEVTILFTDIRDFTTISERQPPEEVTPLLSAYFQVMTDIVERHNGVIVQYLGDSIYAMWNAPISDPEHVNDGCRCALALRDAVGAFNARNGEAGLPELVTRYGLHTGIAVVGDIGAQSRRQYTAMGDTVNVASRLEGLNKEFGTSILVSAAIKERADSAFRLRPLGLVRAKGRVAEIEIFELVGTS